MRPGISAGLPPMAPNIGIDIVEVSRIRHLANHYGDRFLRKIYTAHELAVCMAKARPAESLAARFAAKEAFAKAWTGPVMPGWHDVEVAMDGPRPNFRLSGIAAGVRARLSLSHTHQFAVAVAWIEGDPQGSGPGA
jgi:holo-[acyl-carrier protein] synthase